MDDSGKSAAIAAWKAVLDDTVALLESPGRHHKVLVVEANNLHRMGIVGQAELSDMLELADSALGYAIEEQCSS